MSVSGTAASNTAFVVSVAGFAGAAILAGVGLWRWRRGARAARYAGASLTLLLISGAAMLYAATPA
jgi:uncharacterized membrane protein